MTGEKAPTPSSFGKYKVAELIGEGGFGRVFKGWDPNLKRPVAIKTCSLRQSDMRERFIREAEIAANLQHANITTVYDFGEEAGEPYLVQEYLSGEDLDHVVKRRDALPLGTKIHYLLQIAEGLRYAHSRGVIHRDVKPANMRVLDDGQVRIMDFGIAKLVEETQRLTQVGMTIGTAGYLSPEQLLGLEVDPRADIFSLGVLGYELVTFQRPFEADSVSALFYAIAHEDPRPLREIWPDCPPDLAACVTRCLEKDREQRYQELGEVIRDLRRVLANLLPADGAPAGVAAPLLGVSAGPEEPTLRYEPLRRGPAASSGSTPPSHAPAPLAPEPTRRRLRPIWGLGAAAAIVAVFAILNLARWGESVPDPGDTIIHLEDSVGAVADSAVAVTDSSGSGVDRAGTAGAVADPSGSTAGRDSAGATSTSPSSTGATPDTGGTTVTSGADATSYRGTHTLILIWSDGGDAAAALTAETAFLEEFRRRGLAVADPAVLQILNQDPATRATAQTGDAGALGALGRENGAEVLVTGSLRTEAQPSVGQFFTGRAVLDIRVYRVSSAELLRAETYQVGVAGTPGKLGPSPLAAETEAAREVGARAAVGLARDLGSGLPRSR